MTIGPTDKQLSFQLKNIDGEILDSEELGRDAKGLAVIFSCNHCPYVLAWEDRLIALGLTYQSKGIQFALINANDAERYPDDSFPEMVKRSELKGYPFPYLHDEDQSVARAYGATRTPEVFLFNSNGERQYHGCIDDNYDNPSAVRSSDFRNALDAVLEGKTPELPETPPVGCTIKWK